LVTRERWFRTRRGRGGLIAIAAVAGVLAGTAAVYVSRSADGNAALTAVNCADALAAAKRVAPLAKGEVAAFRPAKAGDALTDLVFLGPDGERASLSAFAGKTVLVNLWATWCVPCRAEMPTLNRLQAERAGNDFAVVAIDLDVGEAARRAPAASSGAASASGGAKRDGTWRVVSSRASRPRATVVPAGRSARATTTGTIVPTRSSRRLSRDCTSDAAMPPQAIASATRTAPRRRRRLIAPPEARAQR